MMIIIKSQTNCSYMKYPPKMLMVYLLLLSKSRQHKRLFATILGTARDRVEIYRSGGSFGKQLSCVINRTASRNIIAGKSALVDAVNASSRDDLTSTQRDDRLAANSTAAHNFIEDLDLLLINQDHRQH